MDFRQLMGGMASGMGQGMMDKEFSHAYNAGQEGFVDPLRGGHATNAYTTEQHFPELLKEQQLLAKLKADRTRGRGPQATNMRPMAMEGGQ